VRRYLRAGSVDALLAGGVRVSVLDSFKPYLHDRLANSVRNATVLHREITERGYTCRLSHSVAPFFRIVWHPHGRMRTRSNTPTCDDAPLDCSEPYNCSDLVPFSVNRTCQIISEIRAPSGTGGDLVT